MKKHPDADALAARLTAAANQPPVKVPEAPKPVQITEAVKASEISSEQTKPKSSNQNRKPRTAKTSEEGSVPISLRPSASLWDRYVMAAAERTRKVGRVISAQQIMLEVLEREI